MSIIQRLIVECSKLRALERLAQGYQERSRAVAAMVAADRALRDAVYAAEGPALDELIRVLATILRDDLDAIIRGVYDGSSQREWEDLGDQRALLSEVLANACERLGSEQDQEDLEERNRHLDELRRAHRPEIGP